MNKRILCSGTKNISRLLAAALTFTCMVPAGGVFAASASYSDVNGTAYETAVNTLSEEGVLQGYEDGSFKPENNITRAEICKILGVIIQNADASDSLADDSALKATAETLFNDLSGSGWAAPYIGIAAKYEIVNGYGNNTFAPRNNITYNELAAMTVRACEYDMSGISGSWPSNYMTAAAELKLFDGCNEFDSETDGGEYATRGNAAILINNALSAVKTAAADGYNTTDTSEGTSSETITSAVTPAKSLSLEEAVEIMQTTGMLAQTADINRKSDLAVAQGYRQTESNISSTLNNSSYLDLNTLYTLQQSGVTSTNLKITQLQRTFLEENLDNNYQAEMNNIESSTVSLYYGILQAQMNVEVCESSVKLQEAELENVKAKHDVGSASDIELSTQQYNVTSAKDSLSQAQQTLASAQSEFNTLMGIAFDTELTLTTPLAKVEAELPSIEEAVASMNENNLTLKYYDYLAELAEMQYDSLRFTTSLSSSTYRQAGVAYEQAKLGIEQSEKNMETTLRSDYSNLKDLENQIATYEATIEITEKSLNVVQTQYDIGMATLSEVNSTQLQLQQAKLGLASAIVNYNTAVMNFMFSTGVGTTRISFS